MFQNLVSKEATFNERSYIYKMNIIFFPGKAGSQIVKKNYNTSILI